ncbi:SapC family protein [Paenalcaligenes hominis]|uniref:SapC family protein n=1 Tax=Paenalcaligenes hominis TaxID=643674 RepID=UPI003526BD87
MSANYQILNQNHSEQFYWIPPANLSYIAGQPLLPLHAGELALAASTMPVAITQLGGVWQLVAVAGLQPQHNLFVLNGEWLGRYQPRCISTYDFDLHQMGKAAFLRFNLSGKLAAQADSLGAQPLMQGDGSLTPAVQTIQDQLLKDAPLFARTQQAVQALADAQVLMPWPTALVDALGMKLPELYCLNEAALAKLPDADFLALRQAQALGIGYGVNMSLQQGHLLLRLQRHNPAVDSADQVDVLFGSKGDDTIRFNF